MNKTSLSIQHVFYFNKHCTSYSILYGAIVRYATGVPAES